MGTSTLQFEHLIDGKKPDGLAKFAMFACHLFPRLIASRNASVLLVHKHAWMRLRSNTNPRRPICLLPVDMTEKLMGG